MSLASVSNTALSALSAIGMAFDVIANNLANAQTDGFKESHTLFTDAAPVSYGLGSPPNARTGGTNPIQVGIGMGLAFLATDLRQGSIVLSADPLDMAAGNNSRMPEEAGTDVQIVSGAREMSNTDIGSGLIEMALNLEMFRVNAFVFQSADRLFDDLLSLRRA